MDSSATANESFEWSAWLPNGFRNEFRKYAKLFAVLFWFWIRVMRWFVAGSLLAALGVYAVYRDAPSAFFTAKVLMVACGAMIVGPAFVVLVGALIELLIRRTYRIDRDGIKFMDRTYKWAEIVDVRVRHCDGVVPYVEVSSTSKRKIPFVRLAVPANVSLPTVVATIEHWYGRPIPSVHGSPSAQEA